MEVETISRECIKPSAPTPLHLKHTNSVSKINFAIILLPLGPYTIPLINLSDASDIDHILGFSMNFNDEGIYFVEDRSKSPLNEFLNQPDPSLKLLSGRNAGTHVANVQITSFPCGGRVICACFSHMLGDGTSFSLFMKPAVMCPNFDASILFRPNEAYPRELNWNSLFTRFFETAIADLKAKAIISSCEKNPTCVEIVSAQLSKHIMAAFKLKSPRPPLPGNLIGNIVWHANVLCEDEEVELAGLASQLREVITKLDGDFLKSLQGTEAYYDVKYRIIFSSWCTFGFYEIHFGWGRPTWVRCVGLDGSIITHSPIIILTDTRLRDGIEAWVFLLEEDMALLEVDRELLAFATIGSKSFHTELTIW
ncbi:HXXXD-type acyl-transferase family protein [Citrus sinensis]|uniref:HXXXD-type acyl-transferase family protein n=1 Tax=Citrus sinensis TaxID=2711 RepID=A0ACB8JJ54_CITSI|nr:HXXXD-type acyl-transferase family protein [Citrus sinensis]